MAELKSVNGRPTIDYMARDYDSLLLAMRALIPEKLPEWTDYESQADFGNVLLQLFAHMGDILSYYQDRVANESFLGTAQQRRSVIQHLRLIGYQLSTAAPASATLTLTVPAGYTDIITINRGDAFATRTQRDAPPVRFEYTREQPLRIDCRALPTDAANRKYYHGIPVEEGRLVREEILGTSDGTPNQRFPLAHAGLILRSLGQGQAIQRDIILLTDLEGILEEWTLQESLVVSREGQKDFMVEIDEDDRASVLFGDGAFGAIPPKDAVIKATYRVGGGLHGNVAPQTIRTIIDAPRPGPPRGADHQPQAGHRWGGAGKHRPCCHACSQRVPLAQAGGDRRGLRSPGARLQRRGQGACSINQLEYGQADRGPTGRRPGERGAAGQPAGLLRRQAPHFNHGRHCCDADIYVPIYVTATIGVTRYYASAEVKERVQQAAGRLLAFDNVDFGQTIYLSKFYEAIEAIDGVDFVNISEFRREGAPADTVEPEGRIVLLAHEIPIIPTDDLYAGGIKVLFEGGN